VLDHLTAWREIREQVPWKDVRHGPGWPTGPVRGRSDGIEERIAKVDYARDPARAQQLLTAYELMRDDAAAGKAMDFDLLATWQRLVLDVTAAPFRDAPAFAKGGRERYGLDAETPARFAECLAEADSGNRDVPVAARAARVYLDVCFFHPFADGNARSALLALAFVLARDGIVLDEVGPVAQVSRPAADAEGAAGLAGLVVALIEGTRRRRWRPRNIPARLLLQRYEPIVRRHGTSRDER
jgi:hypothetical protein